MTFMKRIRELERDKEQGCIEDYPEEFANPERMFDDEDHYPSQKCQKCGTLTMNDMSPEGNTHRCSECWGFVRKATREELSDFLSAMTIRRNGRPEQVKPEIVTGLARKPKLVIKV